MAFMLTCCRGLPRVLVKRCEFINGFIIDYYRYANFPNFSCQLNNHDGFAVFVFSLQRGIWLFTCYL